MYTKKEMIDIGQFLKSVDIFKDNVRINNIPDAKNKERVYIQVRSYTTVNKKRIWFSKYVGVKDKYTAKDLGKATKSLLQRYHNYVNQQLAQYNCKIEDFK